MPAVVPGYHEARDHGDGEVHAGSIACLECRVELRGHRLAEYAVAGCHGGCELTKHDARDITDQEHGEAGGNARGMAPDRHRPPLAKPGPDVEGRCAVSRGSAVARRRGQTKVMVGCH